MGPEKAALKPSPVVSSIATPRLPVDVASAVRKLHPRYCAVFHPDGYFCWVGSMYLYHGNLRHKFMLIVFSS